MILVPQSTQEVKARQVAVAPHAQGQGVGRALTKFAEDFARQRGFTTITLHARATAVPIYEKATARYNPKDSFNTRPLGGWANWSKMGPRRVLMLGKPCSARR